MLSKSKIVGSLAGLGFFLALTPNIAWERNKFA